MKGIGYNVNLGKEFGKPDLERLGIFVEMPYMNGKGYVSMFPKPPRHKGPSFLADGRKTKNGTQHGYFEDTFKRICEGEGINWKKKKVLEKPLVPFILGSRGKKSSGSGDYFGTFEGKVEHFSNVRRPTPKYKSPLPNFVSSNPKKGGPGYANICLNPYPEHKEDPYKPKDKKKYGIQNLDGPMVTAHYPKAYFDENPFPDPAKMAERPIYVDNAKKPVGNLAGIFMPTGPGKWQGGCHGGCFDKFPEFKPCKYVSSLEANKPSIGSKGPVFNPPPIAMKTMFTTSVVNYNTDLRVNNKNYKKYQPEYVKYLLD